MVKRSLWFLIIIAGALALGGFAARGRYFPFFGKMLAQIGITVGVAPNPYNTLNDQLNEKQAAIDQQQAELAAREAAFASSTAAGDGAAATGPEPVFQYLTLAFAVLTPILVILNFYFDWRRSRGPSEPDGSNGGSTTG